MPRTKADETKTSAKAKAAKKVADTKEVGQAVAAEVDDAKTAVKIETKKTTRAAGRKVKGAIAEAVDKVETKIDNKKLANEMAAGRVKAKRERKATEKQTAKEEKTAAKTTKKVEKTAKKPTVRRKAAKLNMVFQSTMGGSVTPEQIALKLPKEAVDVYVKIEENKAFWVGKNGETGSVDIW